ncbi:preprotein translocase subunit SecG [Buchnera aphidicola (Macrosiphoniella sanborni)]|uniref:Preprotein translocase subunit SecG n=1 Tax=Buchnera aphidicola (Macrosiphoniella sanborni) TaxID=1241865 RepID=A0A4D6Y302_9GAMM|nr:preprotein translocase subunit SecG [Buchnera aphidicola]QCI23906.1 preprotein translocase subunit SecG [Buchnera aphidicola (Macrosiphoniella sanborni)]
MYVFFLVFFIFISISLIVLILLQPEKGLNNTIYSNVKNNVKSLRYVEKNSFIINIIRIFSCLFLLITIILCNIKNRKIDSDFFLEDNTKKTIIKEYSSDKKILNSHIPH